MTPKTESKLRLMLTKRGYELYYPCAIQDTHVKDRIPNDDTWLGICRENEDRFMLTMDTSDVNAVEAVCKALPKIKGK